MNCKYKILQLPNRNNYRFMGYDYAIEHGFSLDDYNEVYKGSLSHMDGSQKEDVLNVLWDMFNCNFPEDYHGRSMSVSDVVVLDNVAYYVDDYGFTKIN